MKTQGTMIQGALAIVGLGAAYATWQREPERAAGEVVVLEALKNDVTRLRYEDEKTWVEVSRVPGEEAPGIAIKLSAREQGTQKLPEREVRGNEQAARLLETFAPLRASRALGTVEPAKLKEFGLAPPDPPAAAGDGGTAAPPPPTTYKKRTLVVTAKGDTHAFALGSPPGLFATYLKDERDGRVYLVGGTLVSDLDGASSRMVDRTLHAFKMPDVDTVTVVVGGKKRELHASAGEAPNQVKLASRSTPDKADETAKNWHEKLFRMFPTDVLGKGEKPAGGEPQAVLKVSYASKGQDKGYVEIGKLTVTPPPSPVPPVPPPPSAKGAPPPAPPAPPAPVTEYWARSEHTAGWVKLGWGTEDIVKESEKIAATE